MKKPKWVSVCGWLVVGLIGFGIGDAIAYAAFGFAFAPRILAALALLVAFPVFVLWVLGSIVAGLVRFHAANQARAVLQAAGGNGLEALAGLGKSGPPALPLPPPAARLCSGCQTNNPVVTCQSHKLSLCAECASSHFEAGACVLVPVSQLEAGADGGARKGTRRPTSPLGLSTLARG